MGLPLTTARRARRAEAEVAHLTEVLKAEKMLRTAVTITSMEAEAIIERVKAVHQPRPGKQVTPCDAHGRFFDSLCVDCRSEPITVCSNITCCDWPCPTIRAVAQHKDP